VDARRAHDSGLLNAAANRRRLIGNGARRPCHGGATFRWASGERIRIAGMDASATVDDPKRFKERLGKLVKHKPIVEIALAL